MFNHALIKAGYSLVAGCFWRARLGSVRLSDWKGAGRDGLPGVASVGDRWVLGFDRGSVDGGFIVKWLLWTGHLNRAGGRWRC